MLIDAEEAIVALNWSWNAFTSEDATSASYSTPGNTQANSTLEENTGALVGAAFGVGTEAGEGAGVGLIVGTTVQLDESSVKP
mmetsp:Transcript_12500/g.20044  ORF Transcript_12500/g.20044 Transcript_12500/m.20044 type:complete len:83 (+) Transcript_12500:274-522(+)